jgi:hypothetical protein
MRWVDENSHELGDCPPTRTPWIVIAWRAPSLTAKVCAPRGDCWQAGRAPTRSPGSRHAQFALTNTLTNKGTER